MQSSSPKVPSLPIDRALQLVPFAEGNLCVGDLPILSLPCILEIRDSPSRTVLVTHFERAREDYMAALRNAPIVRVQFVIGLYYIDPSWIPRTPHAPTEVKAAFEFKGRAKLLDRSESETIAMMTKVATSKQTLFAPESNWKIEDLPSDYTGRLFPMIAELEIEPEEYNLSRLMVLSHLSEDHRNHILSKIYSIESPCSRAVRRLFQVTYH